MGGTTLSSINAAKKPQDNSRTLKKKGNQSVHKWIQAKENVQETLDVCAAKGTYLQYLYEDLSDYDEDDVFHVEKEFVECYLEYGCAVALLNKRLNRNNRNLLQIDLMMTGSAQPQAIEHDIVH